MSDKNFGYIGKKVNQSFGNNNGVLGTEEINQLVEDDKFSQYGQLELIETRTVTTPTLELDWTDIKENVYDNHLLIFNNVQTDTATQHLGMRLSVNGGTSYLSSQYDWSGDYVVSSGGSGNNYTTTNAWWYLSGPFGNLTNETADGYAVLYNFGNELDFASYTSKDIQINHSAVLQYGNNTGHRDTTERINAFRLYLHSGTANIISGTFSLYGYKVYK